MLKDLRRDLSLWIIGQSTTRELLGIRSGLFRLTRQHKLVALLVFIGAGLRFTLLADKSIWLDEAFSITISQHSLVDMLRLIVQADAHPPLYYLVLKLWLILGDGELQARLLSALFSLASIPLMYYLAVLIYNDNRVGLVAATILAISPFHIWYAQETRMYAMLIFFVLASAIFFFRALRSGDPLDWIGYVIATVLALYTDNGAVWYVAALGTFFLFSIKRFKDRITGWFFGSMAIFLLYLPWLPFFWMQTRQVTEEFWLPPPSFQTVLQAFLDFHSLNFPIIELSLVYMAAIFVFAYIIPRKSWQLSLASILLFIPLAVSLLFSLRQPVFLSRNLIAASLGFYLLVAGVIGQFRSNRATLAFLLPLVLMNLVSIGYNNWYEEKENWRSVANYMASETRGKPGGLVVFLPGYAELPFNYYFKRFDRTIKTQGYPSDEILLHPRPHDVKDPAALINQRPYVWLVVRDIETEDPDWAVKTWLDAHGYVRQRDLVRDNLTVLSYYRWDKAPPGQAGNNQRAGLRAFLPIIQRKLALQTYTVRLGETLLEIALRYDTTVQVLMELNGLDNPLNITAGQKLKVPAGEPVSPPSREGAP